MSGASLPGLRRWASSQMQPIYNRLPSTEHMDEGEFKDEDLGESGSTSGRSNSTSSSGDESFDHGLEGTGLSSHHISHGSGITRYLHLLMTAIQSIIAGIIALPVLAIRYLMLPFRRGRSSPPPTYTPVAPGRWPALFAQLEELQVLVPSFLHPVAPGTQKKLHPSAWLDGLRGLAAFLVVWHHSSLLWFSWEIHYGYGSRPTDRWFIQLPLIRLFISGQPHVFVFFVISGYALSYKPLRLSRQGRLAEAGEAIHSSVFRRWTRLFLMPLVVSLVAALFTYLDFYGGKDWKGVAIPSRAPAQAGTLWGQLENLGTSFMSMADPLVLNVDRRLFYMYDPNLWTLPVEFAMSMILFLCQAALNRFRPRIRMLCMAFCTVYAFSYIHWQAFLFFAGMLMCDLHFELDGLGGPSKPPQAPAVVAPQPVEMVQVVQVGANESLETTTPVVEEGIIIPTTPTSPPPIPTLAPLPDPLSTSSPPTTRTKHRQIRWTIYKCICFVALLFVMSIPDEGHGAAQTPGFITLVKLLPTYHAARHALDAFYMPLAAVGIVFTVDRTPFLQRIFTHPFSQYFGYISYSMYLIHGTVIWTIGHWTIRKAVAVIGMETQWQYGLAVMVSAAVVWTVTIILADLATRTIDKKAVTLGRDLYEWCSLPEKKEEADLLPRTR
ncbi:hypothetical protein SBRCBS47491_001670 [Sporothrix bragantina]|uniref:Acyltransferase 3 domain-containing protein n=1 Tax=Sporothrix bragantina TaxID=671064 RepID=A0ABP0B0F2_9PEZI